MKLRLPLLLAAAVLACFSTTSLRAADQTISANTTYSANADWNGTTTIGANNLTLTINGGVLIEQKTGAFNIVGQTLTLNGGGTLKIDTAATVKFTGNLTVSGAGTTLDLSNENAALNLGDGAGGFSDAYVTASNGGIILVEQLAYGTSFGAIRANTGHIKLDNGTIKIMHNGDSIWDYGVGISASGGTIEAGQTGKTISITSSGFAANDLAGTLTLTGPGNFTTSTENTFTGVGGLKKTGTGTLTLGASQSFSGGVELNQGTLIAT
ncbi:MAG: autotransporter-associated beta strand repeat-containing protein, partial [Akkermansia sp.]